MDPQKYLELLGSQLAHELTAHDKIRAFVGRHPDLIGNYAEASTRDFISRVVAPLKVSTGTILYEENYGKEPPQLDAIVWSPNPVPAIFEGGNFAIVPRGSAHGYFEIKSSSYKNTGEVVAQKLAYAEKLIVPRLEGYIGALGVVCVATKPDKKLLQLVKEKRAAILLCMKNGELTPNPAGIWTLVNFLTTLRFQARAFQATHAVNYPDEPQPKPAKKRHSQARNGGKAKAWR